MRRKDRQFEDRAVIDKVINESQVCRMALVNENMPYIIPMSFGYDGKNIFIHSAVEGQKINIIEKNPRVCVEFADKVQTLKADKPCNWSVQYISVIGHGWAEKLTDAQEKNYGLNQIVSQYQPDVIPNQFTQKELNSVLVFKIHLEEISGKIAGMSIEEYLK